MRIAKELLDFFTAWLILFVMGSVFALFCTFVMFGIGNGFEHHRSNRPGLQGNEDWPTR